MGFTTKRGGYVYLIEHEHGFVKIGASNNPMDRLNGIRGMTPYEVFLKTTIDIKGDRETVEKELHDIYQQYNVSHEWFDLPDEEIEYLQEINQLHVSTIDGYTNWTPAKHLEIDPGRLDELRGLENNTALLNDVRELAAMIVRDDFPESNLNAENSAIERRARKRSVSPEGYVQQVEQVLKQATPDETHENESERRSDIRDIITDLENDFDDGAAVSSILNKAQLQGFDRDEAEHQVEILRRQGDVYEPTADHFRTV